MWCWCWALIPHYLYWSVSKRRKNRFGVHGTLWLFLLERSILLLLANSFSFSNNTTTITWGTFCVTVRDSLLGTAISDYKRVVVPKQLMVINCSISYQSCIRATSQIVLLLMRHGLWWCINHMVLRLVAFMLRVVFYTMSIILICIIELSLIWMSWSHFRMWMWVFWVFKGLGLNLLTLWVDQIAPSTAWCHWLISDSTTLLSNLVTCLYMLWCWAWTTWATAWNNTTIYIMVCCRIYLFLTTWTALMVSWTRHMSSACQIRWSCCWILVVTSWRLSLPRWMDGLIIVWVSTSTLCWELACFSVHSCSVVRSTRYMWISEIIMLVMSIVSCWTRAFIARSISVFWD